jgi:hypothetical protein
MQYAERHAASVIIDWRSVPSIIFGPPSCPASTLHPIS